MRCSCKRCGTYMVQAERGLNSGCCCPECFEFCSDCMGSRETPVSKDSLAGYMLINRSQDNSDEINDYYDDYGHYDEPYNGGF
ncbi:MAG: hypothetical protein IJF80_07610 [Clostridia bacterium]|nr:hypothetical protein [Clostridia bacterium]